MHGSGLNMFQARGMSGIGAKLERDIGRLSHSFKKSCSAIHQKSALAPLFFEWMKEGGGWGGQQVYKAQDCKTTAWSLTPESRVWLSSGRKSTKVNKWLQELLLDNMGI